MTGLAHPVLRWKGTGAGRSQRPAQQYSPKGGWTLEYVYADDYSEFEQALNEGRADVILSILYDYDAVQRRNVRLSNPYLETRDVCWWPFDGWIRQTSKAGYRRVYGHDVKSGR